MWNGESSINRNIAVLLAGLSMLVLATISHSAVQQAFAQTNMGNSVGAINVRDLGAKGDASTDDTRVIQTALRKAKAAKVKKVFLPAGTYLVSDTIVLYDNVHLIGAGKDSTILRMVKTDKDLIDVGNARDAYIGHLQVRGVTNPGLDDENWGIVTRAAVRPIIESVKAASNDDAGIRIGYSTSDLLPTRRAKVVSCEVVNTKEGSGIEVIRAEDTIIKGNTIVGSKQHGIRLCGAIKTTVINNKVINNGYGISVQGFTNGVELLQSVTSFNILRNRIANNNEAGISVYNKATEGTIAENRISFSDSSRNYIGIDLNAVDSRGNQNIKIVNNTILNARKSISLFDRQEEIYILRNTLHSPHRPVPEAYGVFIDADSMNAGSVNAVYIEHNNLVSRYNRWYPIRARDLPKGAKVYARYNTIHGNVSTRVKFIAAENGEKLITRVDGKETNSIEKRPKTDIGQGFVRRVVDSIRTGISKILRSLVTIIKDVLK